MIDISLNSIPKDYRPFVDYTIHLAKQHNVNVILSKERHLKLSKHMSCNGYFQDEEPEFAVACGQSFDSWFNIFIHESSHMDQWIEQCPEWVTSDIDDMLTDWLEHDREFPESQLINANQVTIQAEVDCDRRVLKKIEKWKLPINIQKYAQVANAYSWFYHYMLEVRKWYTVGKEPFNNPEIVKRMPTNLDADFITFPEEIRQIFKKYMRF